MLQQAHIHCFSFTRMSGINENLLDSVIKQMFHTTRIKCNFYGDSRINSTREF